MSSGLISIDGFGGFGPQTIFNLLGLRRVSQFGQNLLLLYSSKDTTIPHLLHSNSTTTITNPPYGLNYLYLKTLKIYVNKNKMRAELVECFITRKRKKR